MVSKQADTPRSTTSPSDRGIFGLSARLREGKQTGWGVFHGGSKSMFIGGLMMIVAAFLPWVMIPLGDETFMLRGTDGPGVLTLSLGFLAFAGAFVPRRRIAIAHALIPGVIVGVIVSAQAIRILQLSAQTGSWGGLLPGMGLILAAGGSIILIRIGIRMWRSPAPGS